jgi:hypothetical protein
VDAVRLYRKHPETGSMLAFDWCPGEEPAGWKKRAAARFGRFYAWLERHRLDRGPLFLWRFFFQRLSWYHYFKGVRHGLAAEDNRA